MQEADVVGDLFFPAYEQSPGPVQPRMSAFDFPTPSFSATVLRLRGFVSLTRDVRLVAALADLAVNGFTSIAFVEAKVLRLCGRGFRALDRDGVERGGNQFLVRHIGAVYGNCQRHAAAIDQR